MGDFNAHIEETNNYTDEEGKALKEFAIHTY